MGKIVMEKVDDKEDIQNVQSDQTENTIDWNALECDEDE